MKLKTKQLTLRELKDNDLTNLVRLTNNLNISQYLEEIPYPYTKQAVSHLIFEV